MISKTALLAVVAAMFPAVYGSATPAPAPAAGAGPAWPTHWGYDGSEAPHFWDEVNPTAYALCATGKQQSPINLDTTDEETKGSITSKVAGDVVRSWPAVDAGTGLKFVNKGHTLQVETFPETFTTVYDGVTYSPLQFHFHTPSEHHFAGDFAPMEVHFVHKSADGKLAVLGIAFDISDANTNSTFLNGLAPLISNIPTTGASFNLTTLDLPSLATEVSSFADGFYTYKGSLTTPPCTEGISWIVAKNRASMSPAQFNAFRKQMKFSARQTQRRTFAAEINRTPTSGAGSVIPGVLAAIPLVAQLFL